MTHHYEYQGPVIGQTDDLTVLYGYAGTVVLAALAAAAAGNLTVAWLIVGIAFIAVSMGIAHLVLSAVDYVLAES